MLDFEWDSEKARINENKHGVSFFEASEVFCDDLSSTVNDPDHSVEEDRYLIFGRTLGGKTLVVSFTARNGKIRLISARRMTPRERKAYEN